MAGRYQASSARQRGAASLAVGAIHAGLAFALVTGMPGVAQQPIRERTFTGISLNTPAHGGDGASSEGVPEGVIVQRRNVEPGHEAAPEPLDRIDNPVISCFFGWSHEPEVPLTYEDFLALAERTDAITAPVPLTDPSSWFDVTQIPLRQDALVADWMRYSLTIDPDGTVADCAVLRASFSGPLDAAICRSIATRARFEPARGADGGEVVGTYRGTLRWDLPV